MHRGLLIALFNSTVCAMILRDVGLGGNGIYYAAWGLSSLFANFVIRAMGIDFYPQATAAANDNAHLNRPVNKQVEVGILIAVPGLIATFGLGSYAVVIFYSVEVALGAVLLPWFVLGIFGCLILYPLGYTLLAIKS